MHIKSFAKSVELDELDEINFLKFQFALIWSTSWSVIVTIFSRHITPDRRVQSWGKHPIKYIISRH